MIKKISQLDKYPEVPGQFNPNELSNMLLEVSYKKNEGDEQDYYQSYSIKFKEVYDALGVTSVKELVQSVLDGALSVVSGDLSIGLPGHNELSDRSVDTYNPGNSDLDIYANTEIQNNLKVHGTTEFHNNVVLSCNDAYADNKNRPILTVTGRSTFTKLIDGTAYRAQWGDLAEYYLADEKYEPGTLIKFGGEKEITIASGAANGVVTTEPGVILNGKETEYSVGVALVGKVPIRIRGPVHKFDKIVLSHTDPGTGVVYNYAHPYEIIGRALEENLDKEEKLVQCATQFNVSQG